MSVSINVVSCCCVFFFISLLFHSVISIYNTQCFSAVFSTKTLFLGDTVISTLDTKTRYIRREGVVPSALVDDLRQSTVIVLKFKTVKASVCLPKDLKNSFLLSHIYSLLSYIRFFSLLFFFFCFFKIIHSIFYAVPTICVMYPMLSGSL